MVHLMGFSHEAIHKSLNTLLLPCFGPVFKNYITYIVSEECWVSELPVHCQKKKKKHGLKCLSTRVLILFELISMYFSCDKVELVS